jgi:predicted phage tail protein
MSDEQHERRVTHGEFQDFSKRMERRHEDVMGAIKDARVEARDAHNRLREDWIKLLTASIEHEGRMDRVEADVAAINTARATDAKEATAASRFFWAQVVGVSSIAAGLFMWIASLLKGAKP